MTGRTMKETFEYREGKWLEELKRFLTEHEHDDAAVLRLKYLSNGRLKEFERRKYEFFILQLEAQRKFGKKLSSAGDVIYPSMIAGEQSSNSEVAHFHASLMDGERTFLDMTAGLGIDFMIMAGRINPYGNGCTAIEMDEEKAECLILNLQINGLGGAEVDNEDSLLVLEKMRREGKRVDLIYVDPARRSHKGGRIYNPSECSPDVIGNKELINAVGERILIKNSPMLDITKCISLFPEAEVIYIVDWKNECKEILVDCRRGAKLQKITAVEVINKFDFHFEEFTPSEMKLPYSKPYLNPEVLQQNESENELWIYEPSSSVMKIGAWEVLARKYELIKFSPNCHLFLSDKLHPDFPGRISRLIRIINKKCIKMLKGEKRNVVTRNYPLKAAALSEKMKVISGGEIFIYGSTVGVKETPVIVETEHCNLGQY